MNIPLGEAVFGFHIVLAVKCYRVNADLFLERLLKTKGWVNVRKNQTNFNYNSVIYYLKRIFDKILLLTLIRTNYIYL
jgi:hypothetical protein